MKRSAFWMEHVAAIKRESISTSAYAKRHGLAVKSLYYWQHKLQGSMPQVPSCASKAKAFVALRVSGPVDDPHQTGCTLVLASGVRLEMSTLPAPEWVIAVGCVAQGMR